MYRNGRNADRLVIHTSQRMMSGAERAAEPAVPLSGAVEPATTHTNESAMDAAVGQELANGSIPAELPSAGAAGRAERVRRTIRPAPARSRKAARAARAKSSARWRKRVRAERKASGEKLTAGERLMRNSAIACALLLMVLAVKNVNQPWSEQATQGIRQAMTMRLDLDETLGRLQFVRALIPETALVFFNLDAERDLVTPVSGTVSHTYAAQQPWLQYECQPGQAVLSAAAGTVATIGQGAEGDYIVSLNHEDGMQTVYAYLKSVSVSAGQKVDAGQQLGILGDEKPALLYFELRESGQSADPTARLRTANQ